MSPDLSPRLFSVAVVAVFPIRVFGDPVLRVRTGRVDVFDGRLRRLVGDMVATMCAAGGVGLAATQIGVLKRVCVFDVGSGPGVLVNPVIVDSSGSWEYTEGCLSVPGRQWLIARPAVVTARGEGLDGEQVTYTGGGLLGRVLQHEVDHLDGLLLVDRLDPVSRRAALGSLYRENVSTCR